MRLYSLGEIQKRDIQNAIYLNTEKKNVLYALNLERELEELNITISSSIERFTGGRLLALMFDKEKITKLSSMIRRWDNAPHWRDIRTFPFHLHIPDKDKPIACGEVFVNEVPLGMRNIIGEET